MSADLFEDADKNDLESVSGLLFSLPVTWFVNVVSFIGAIILLWSVGKETAISGIWRDVFYFMGFLVTLANFATFVLISWIIIKSFGGLEASGLLDRKEHSTISGIAIGSAAITLVFGITALLFTFGPVFVGTGSDATVAGYAMMILATLHAAFSLYMATRGAVERPTREDYYRA